MTVGGNGGMITTNDKKIAEMVKLLREHGGSNFAKYVGYNARMNTMNAAFGRVQLRRLDEWNNRRRSLAKLYYEYLKDIHNIKLPIIDDRHVYHLFVIEAENRDELREYLKSKEIMCGIHYPVAIHELKPYREYADRGYPNSEYHSKTCLSLPMYPTLKESDLKMVCDEIKRFYGG